MHGMNEWLNEWMDEWRMNMMKLISEWNEWHELIDCNDKQWLLKCLYVCLPVCLSDLSSQQQQKQNMHCPLHFTGKPTQSSNLKMHFQDMLSLVTLEGKVKNLWPSLTNVPAGTVSTAFKGVLDNEMCHTVSEVCLKMVARGASWLNHAMVAVLKSCVATQCLSNAISGNCMFIQSAFIVTQGGACDELIIFAKSFHCVFLGGWNQDLGKPLALIFTPLITWDFQFKPV